METDKLKFKPKQVWKATLWRYVDRLTAFTARASRLARKAHNNGRPPPTLTTQNRWLAPMAHLIPREHPPGTTLIICPTLQSLLEEANVKTRYLVNKPN